MSTPKRVQNDNFRRFFTLHSSLKEKLKRWIWAELLPSVTFVLARRNRRRFKPGMRLFLSKFSLRLTQSVFLLSPSLPLSFSSSSNFFLSSSPKSWSYWKSDDKKHKITGNFVVTVCLHCLLERYFESRTTSISEHEKVQAVDSKVLSGISNVHVSALFRVFTCKSDLTKLEKRWVSYFFSSHQQSVLQSTTSVRPGCPGQFCDEKKH